MRRAVSIEFSRAFRCFPASSSQLTARLVAMSEWSTTLGYSTGDLLPDSDDEEVEVVVPTAPQQVRDVLATFTATFTAPSPRYR